MNSILDNNLDRLWQFHVMHDVTIIIHASDVGTDIALA